MNFVRQLKSIAAMSVAAMGLANVTPVTAQAQDVSSPVNVHYYVGSPGPFFVGSGKQLQMHGQADLIRSAGVYNLLTTKAIRELETARSQAIETNLRTQEYHKAKRQTERRVELDQQAQRRERRLKEAQERAARQGLAQGN